MPNLTKTVIAEYPTSIAQLEIIGDGPDCLCGVPGCPGHPVATAGAWYELEFSADQYNHLLVDLNQRLGATDHDSRRP